MKEIAVAQVHMSRHLGSSQASRKERVQAIIQLAGEEAEGQASEQVCSVNTTVERS